MPVKNRGDAPMKRYLILIIFISLCAVSARGFGIVTGGNDRDTLSLPFMVLDSLGNPVDLADGDSAYIAVFYPGGAIAYRDSMVYNDSRIKTCSWEDFDGAGSYVFAEKVSILNGSSPVNGVYSYVITVDDNTGADLVTPSTGYFQLVNAAFGSSLDSASFARKIIDSLENILDSLSIMKDSLESLNGRMDSASLAGIIWNTPQDNHNLNGTFGSYLDAEISGLGAGTGLYSIELTAFDSSTFQPIPGAGMAVRNLDQSALIAVGRTDSYGLARFNLDSDCFLVAAFAPGYIFDSFDTIVVNGPLCDSILACRFDPGNAPDPNLCRVYGFIYNVNGEPEAGATVSAWLPTGVARAGAGIISPFRVQTTTDNIGYFYFDLIPGAALNPDTTHYEITISRSDGTILRERVIVPDQSSWLLTW